jgi:hypothetical protein
MFHQTYQQDKISLFFKAGLKAKLIYIRLKTMQSLISKNEETLNVLIFASQQASFLI